MGNWEIDQERPDLLTNLISGGHGISEVDVTNKDTGENKTIVVWSGDDDYVRQQVVDAIENGDFKEE